jgi:hypothetical protein
MKSIWFELRSDIEAPLNDIFFNEEMFFLKWIMSKCSTFMAK